MHPKTLKNRQYKLPPFFDGGLGGEQIGSASNGVKHDFKPF